MAAKRRKSVKSIIEGLIFAADEPLNPKQVKELIEEGREGTGASITPQYIQKVVADLNREYEEQGKPYHILSIAGGYIFGTNRDVATYVGKLHKEQAKRRVTQAGLETLAIIAYKQPLTKMTIETIRGVNSDYIVKSLMEKDLVTVVGREPGPGRPLLYGTTNRFLQHFGLNSISDLPKPREIEELIGESQLEVEKRLLEMEKEMEESQEDAKRRREHKPHPITEEAMAKIIPLKPDYVPARRSTTPLKKKSTEGEEPDTVQRAEEDNVPSVKSSPGVRDKTRDSVKPGTASSSQRITHTPDAGISETEKGVGEDATEEPETPAASGNIRTEQETSGWRKWKNKIVTIIKKIFG